jgi:hypothetical protein
LDISSLIEYFPLNDTFSKSVRTLKGLNVNNAKYIDLEKFTALQNIEIKLKVIDDKWVNQGIQGENYDL